MNVDFRKSYERQIKDLKDDLELERQTIADYLKHKARMTDLLAQLQAQIEVLSAVSNLHLRASFFHLSYLKVTVILNISIVLQSILTNSFHKLW